MSWPGGESFHRKRVTIEHSFTHSFAPPVRFSGKICSRIKKTFLKPEIGEHTSDSGCACMQMDDRLDEILNAADWRVFTPKLIAFARTQICRAFWRGLPVKVSSAGLPCLDGMGAEDFVQSAVGRLLDGGRSYNFDYSLEQNIKGIIRSMIWNWNKSANRQPVTSASISYVDDDRDRNLIELVAGEQPSASEQLVAKEETETKQALIAAFEQFLKDDIELTRVIGAYKAGFFTPREIENSINIKAACVSELKRKLSAKLHAFIALKAAADTSFKENTK